MRAGIPNNTFRVCSGGGPRYPSTPEEALFVKESSAKPKSFLPGGFEVRTMNGGTRQQGPAVARGGQPSAIRSLILNRGPQSSMAEHGYRTAAEPSGGESVSASRLRRSLREGWA